MQISVLFDRWSGRAANLLSLWPVLIPSSAVGIVTSVLAKASPFIAQWGAFGWWCVFLAGTFATLMIFGAASWIRYRWLIVSYQRKALVDDDGINPLDNEFTKRRIRIASLAHPATNKITGKKFVDCQLVGPLNLATTGTKVTGAGFINCDFVLMKDKAIAYNVKILDDCTIYGGQLINVTIYVAKADYPAFKQMGVPFVTDVQ